MFALSEHSTCSDHANMLSYYGHGEGLLDVGVHLVGTMPGAACSRVASQPPYTSSRSSRPSPVRPSVSMVRCRSVRPCPLPEAKAAGHRDERAVVACVAAQMGQRDEDLTGVCDDLWTAGCLQSGVTDAGGRRGTVLSDHRRALGAASRLRSRRERHPAPRSAVHDASSWQWARSSRADGSRRSPPNCCRGQEQPARALPPEPLSKRCSAT